MNIPTFSILVIGASGCGKTAFINKQKSPNMVKEHIPSIQLTTTSIIYPTSSGKTRLMLIEANELNEKISFMGISGCLIFFDLGNPHGHEELKVWHEGLKRILTDTIPIIFVGNKSDKELNLDFFGDHMNYGCPYYEISSANNKNIRKPLLELLKILRFDDKLEIGYELEPTSPSMKRSYVPDNMFEVYFNTQGYAILC